MPLPTVYPFPGSPKTRVIITYITFGVMLCHTCPCFNWFLLIVGTFSFLFPTLYLFLSLSLPLSLSAFFSLSRFLSLSLCIYLSFSVSLHLILFLFFSLSLISFTSHLFIFISLVTSPLLSSSVPVYLYLII